MLRDQDHRIAIVVKDHISAGANPLMVEQANQFAAAASRRACSYSSFNSIAISARRSMR